MIYKLGDNLYRVQVELGRDIETGKRKRLTATVHGSKKKAQDKELELKIAAKDQTVVSSLTFGQYVYMSFLPTKLDLVEKTRKGEVSGKKKFKQLTYETYLYRLEKHILPYLKDMPLTSITPLVARQVQEYAPTEAMKKEVRKTLSVVFKEAVYDQLIPYNPMLSVRPPDPPEYEPDVLDMEDIEVYLWHFKDTKAEPIVLLVLGGSYRRGELTALNVEDIDFKTGHVSIDDEIVHSSKGVIRDSPKNHKKRSNILPESILMRLAEILPEEGAVMQNGDGSRMKPASISQLYERTRDKLPDGVPRITLKNLRHTSLTLAFDVSGNMENVANHGGHGVEVSRKRYVRPHDAQEKKLAASMNKELENVLNGSEKS